MRVLFVNNTDIDGRAFNGFDLMLELNKEGYEAHQLVLEKYSDLDCVKCLRNDAEKHVQAVIKCLEFKLGFNNILNPFAHNLEESKEFVKSDIVHYHLIHNHVLPLNSYQKIMGMKRSVWTLHDPWLLTGHCVHPLECTKYLSGCESCPHLNDASFPLIVDTASNHWGLKREIFSKLDVDIVVASKFMQSLVANSPLTRYWQNVHYIPFGICDEYSILPNRYKIRHDIGIAPEDFLIAFRMDANPIKGSQYMLDALDMMPTDKHIRVITVGLEKLPLVIQNKFNAIEFGWVKNIEKMRAFYIAADVFVMPSQEESFGLMAVEAMDCGCPVVVFEKTTLVETTNAPVAAMSVEFGSARSLSSALLSLQDNVSERHRLGREGRTFVKQQYAKKTYVERHKDLYTQIQERNRVNAT